VGSITFISFLLSTCEHSELVGERCEFLNEGLSDGKDVVSVGSITFPPFVGKDVVSFINLWLRESTLSVRKVVSNLLIVLGFHS
jgi:hypothetical protein